MDVFNAPCYRLMKYSATIIGIWPYHTRRMRIMTITIIWIFVFAQFIPQIIALTMYADDPDVQFEACSNMAVYFGAAIKYINAMYKSNQMKKLYDRIISDWKLVKNEEEKKTQQEHADLGNMLSSSWAGIAYCSATFFVLDPIVPKFSKLLFNINETDPYQLPLPLEYIIIDRRKHYWIMLCFTSAMVYNIIIILVSCDIIYINLVQHACGLFAVTGYRLENTPTDENDSEVRKGTDYSRNSEDVPYRHLVSCIRSHRRALEYAELLESLYSISMGLIMGINLPLISITGFQIITKSNTIHQLLKYSTFTISQIAHLFFFCYMSERLTEMSIQMHKCVANVRWFNNSIKSRNLLIIMTMRSQVPCKLTAAKIMDLTIENFSAMVRTSGSYFTMLLSMQ
ncbi:odorant receptor 67c-like [Microplitis mediator]|uniref:odorant receptor 67c-like n=1 Tax=Microplitis mediator TaxID=375433 RepID=UPI0025541850|nr:odorant receptor 67c-like [Microplitis mediator]